MLNIVCRRSSWIEKWGEYPPRYLHQNVASTRAILMKHDKVTLCIVVFDSVLTTYCRSLRDSCVPLDLYLYYSFSRCSALNLFPFCPRLSTLLGNWVADNNPIKIKTSCKIITLLKETMSRLAQAEITQIMLFREVHINLKEMQSRMNPMLGAPRNYNTYRSTIRMEQSKHETGNPRQLHALRWIDPTMRSNATIFTKTFKAS